MSELISGKEAKLAWANGEDVEFRILSSLNHKEWKNIYDASNGFSIQEFDAEEIDFRLKPRTITINGIEVPAPFEPKHGDYVFYITDSENCGWREIKYFKNFKCQFGAWHTEDEIKQVVSALRSIFNKQN